MLKKVKAYIQEHNMFSEGDRVIVAVSGGADSMALLTCLNILKEELGLTLFVAHVNHGLRGSASDADSELAAQMANNLNLPYYQKKLEPGAICRRKGFSLEDAARQERYAFFFQLLNDLTANRIALGHQAQDQAETVLLNLLRGTGAKGLSGILPVRDQVLVRPLLGISRKEILSFLEAEQVFYREDDTNRSPLFLRNRVRHELIPELKTYNLRIEERLCSLADTMRSENEYWDGQVHDILKHWGVNPSARETCFLVKDFYALHDAARSRVIKNLLESRSKDKNGIGQVHIQEVLKLVLEGHAGQRLSLPFQTEVVHEYDKILFRNEKRRIRSKRETSEIEPVNSEQKDLLKETYEHQVTKIPAVIAIGGTGKHLKLSFSVPLESGYQNGLISYIDYDRIEFPLQIRTFNPGDRFRPLGLRGTKKLKSFFIDRKVPRDDRVQVPLLVDRTKILWVGGMAISDDAKVTPRTRTCLKIEII